MKLELAILAGAESKAFLVDFKKQLDRMEKLTKKMGSTESEETEEEENEEEETELEASEESEETEESEESDEESEEETEESEEEEKPAKKATGKITTEQLNDACKARLQKLIKVKKMTSKKAFAEVKALLQKHFDTDSVAQIEKEDRAKALKLLTATVK